MLPLFLIFSIANVILIFISLKRLKEDISVCLLAALTAAILPWYIMLIQEGSWYLSFFSIPLILIALLAKFLRANYKKVGRCLLFLAAFLFLGSVFNIPKYTNVEVDIQRTHADKLGIKHIPLIFSNKLIESFRFRENLLFENIDFGNYLFVGHPRERVGVQEIHKLYFFMVPFLILGLIKVDKNLGWFLAGWGALSLSIPVVLADRSITSGIFLIFPIAYLTALGIMSFKRAFG